jgi:hypothetical protein
LRDAHHGKTRCERLNLYSAETILGESSAMDTVPVTKSPAVNRREGIMLTALQALPAFSGSVLLLKLFGARIVNQPGGAVMFVLIACATLGLVSPWLAPKFPKGFKNYEPLFFDPALSVEEKVQRWLDKPGTAKQLLQTVFMLAILAIAVSSIR